MPWRDHLKRLRDEWGNLTSQPPQVSPYQPYQQQPYPQPPCSSQPQCQQPYQATRSGHGPWYWQPQFHPGIPVTQEWDAKLGNGSDGWGNQELQYYTASPENVFHTIDGKLLIRAISSSDSSIPEQRYTSARLVSRHGLDRDKGMLTAVISLPCADGIWPALWLLPREPFSWPVDGEIDIAETWNGDHENRCCLHWGFHHEPQKHRVLATKIPDMHCRPVRYDFAWDQPGGRAGQGRMIWYIDGRPVMKAQIPEGTRPIREMTILLNIAMGGSTCAGKRPADRYYDMIIHTLFLADELGSGGWHRFDSDWKSPDTPYGNGY